MLLIIKVQPSYQTIFERAEMFLRAIGEIYLWAFCEELTIDRIN